MTDWKAIAKARGLDLPAPDLERLDRTLRQLEEVFAPLRKRLPPDLEPAAEFRVLEEDV